MVLEAPIRSRLDRVLLEQRQRERLTSHGYSPLRKLLLIGAPGTGKTMTASALAGELGVPLFTILLDGLITKFMGETAAKLRLVFDAVASTRGVYFFDEFDALGNDRGAKNDVGEVRRVLNSFLQFLEQDESDSLIVGATNHPALLDHALFRRFDDVLEYGPPSEELALEIIQNRTALLSTAELDWSAVANAAKSLSHAELTKACDQAAKDTILANSTTLKTSSLVTALNERRTAAGGRGGAREAGP
jgi:SpoVK/Ycf46/Vps4 family AAA+-type ATPase